MKLQFWGREKYDSDPLQSSLILTEENRLTTIAYNTELLILVLLVLLVSGQYSTGLRKNNDSITQQKSYSSTCSKYII